SNLVGSGEPERLDGTSVTADVMTTVGVQPAIGRLFASADDSPSAPCTVIISDGLWRQRFDAESSIIGRSILLDGEPCAVIGVMPRAFEFPTRTVRFWRPIRFAANVREDRGNNY